MLGGIVYCIEYCKLHRHTLIIDVKNHLYFKHNFDDFFYIEGFSNYFTNYDSIDKSYHFHRIPLDYIANNNPEYSPTLGYMMKNINVGKSLDSYPSEYKIKIYIGHGGNNKQNILKYIRVKPSIMKIILENTLNCKYTGIHFRNTDRPNNINQYIDKIKNSSHDTVYIATDDYTAYNIFKDSTTKNIIQYTKPFNGNGKAIHMVTDDHYQLNINILIDIYNLYNSDIFIDSPSSLVSQLIKYMRLVKSSIF